MNLRSYGWAVGVFGVATGVSFVGQFLWGDRLVHLVYFPAVLLSAWAGGLGPGFLVSVLSAAAIAYQLPPRYSFTVSDPQDMIGIAVFLVIGLLTSQLGEIRLKRAATVVVKLRQSEQQYRLLFERNLAGVFLVGHEGQMLDCNPMFVTMLGYDGKNDVLSNTMATFFDAAGREAVWADLRRAGAIQNCEVTWRRRDGSTLPVLLNMREVERGVLQGVAVDLSDRARAREGERVATELRAITTLANAAAHEINNPLSVVVGNLEILGSTSAGDRRIAAALNAAHRIHDIVERMSRITRVEMLDRSAPELPPMLDIRRSSDAGRADDRTADKSSESPSF